MTARYHPQLQCNVESIRYDFLTRRGHLDMEDSCCDMQGCIDFFLRIDPFCRRIDTYNNGESDTHYLRRPEGWEAVTSCNVGMGSFYMP